MGTWALVIALAVHAITDFGPGAVGAVLAARLLPAMLAAPLTARHLDRHSRTRTVALFTGAQAAAVAAAAAFVLLDAPLPTLLVAVAASGALGTAARPGLESSMPSLAQTPAELSRATASWAALDNAAFLLGSGGGGILLAVIGPGSAAAIAAILIGWGALLAASLPAVAATEPDEPVGAETLRTELLGGFRVMRDTPSARWPLFLFAGLLLLEGTTDVLLVVLSIRTLGMGNGGPGFLYAVWGLAGILTGPLVLLASRKRGYGFAMSVGVLTHAGGLALMGLDGVPLALAAAIPAGIGFALVETATMALVPRLVDDAVIGRAYGFIELVYTGMSGLGALVGPVLATALGAPGGLIATGSGYAVVGALSWRAMGRLDETQRDAGRVRELLRGVPFLAVLPLPRLERLVRGSRALAVPSGEAIVSRGDVGHDFYVVEEGTIEVAEFGHRQGPGSSFGEIALLHDVTRTATVRALTPVRLRALDRRAFLAAVTNQEDAAAAAHAVAAERLARS